MAHETTFAHTSFCTEKFRYILFFEKRFSSKKNKGRDPKVKKIVSCKKSQKKKKKYCMRCKKLTCGRFSLNRKSVYICLICGKQVDIKPVQSGHAI